MSRIDRLLLTQAEELAKLSDDQARRVLGAFEDSRRLLFELLQQVDPLLTPESAQRIRVMLTQAEMGIGELRGRLGLILSEGERLAHDMLVNHLMTLVKLAEPSFRETGAATEIDIVERLSRTRGLALHRFSTARYGTQVVDQVQREIVASMAAGLTPNQIAKRIASQNGVIAAFKGRAELITRMELSRAYNAGYLDSLHEMNRSDPRPDDPLLKRIEEHIDSRNHPFSRAADGVTAPVAAPFQVRIADVRAKAAAMKRPVGTVLWPKVSTVYSGYNLPAHFNDRGRIVAWRKSWGSVP